MHKLFVSNSNFNNKSTCLSVHEKYACFISCVILVIYGHQIIKTIGVTFKYSKHIVSKIRIDIELFNQLEQ